MKKTLLLLACLAAGPAFAQSAAKPAAQPAAAPASPAPGDLTAFRWFGQLAGSCWKATHPDGKTSDVQCYTSQYGKFIRGSIKVSPGNFEGESLYWWDAKNNRVAYQQWASNGLVARGEATFDGEAMLYIDAPRPGTTESMSRSAWRRVDAKTFTVSREQREAGAWKEAFKVTYTRTK